jgi:hypothetical protein
MQYYVDLCGQVYVILSFFCVCMLHTYCIHVTYITDNSAANKLDNLNLALALSNTTLYIYIYYIFLNA